MSLRLLYLIFLQLLNLLLLRGRSSASKDVELLGAASRSRRAAQSQPEAPLGLGGSSGVCRASPGPTNGAAGCIRLVTPGTILRWHPRLVAKVAW
jgi:putative transposase